MLFGSHVSAAGGIDNAPKNAATLGCEVFQLFSRSPRGGKPNYQEDTFKNFLANCEKYQQQEWYVHTPYYINLASAENRIKHGSISVIREELETASKIKAKYVMTHLGSSKDFTEKKATPMVADGIIRILDGYQGETMLLIENSAGAGKIIGDEFEEIAYIIKKVNSKKLGVCLDTCHAFASGYDFRTQTAINNTLKQFDTLIGLAMLKLMHWNDSLTEFNSKKDRHADLGFGLIGEKAFELLVSHPKLKNVNAITETPANNIPDEQTMKLLKSWRKNLES